MLSNQSCGFTFSTKPLQALNPQPAREVCAAAFVP